MSPRVATRRRGGPGATTLANGLIGYWPMSSQGGGEANLAGVCTLAPGLAPLAAGGLQYPTAREFIRATGHNLVGTYDQEINALDAFTVGLWEYPYTYTGIGGDYNGLVGNGGTPYRSWHLFHTHDGSLVVYIRTETNMGSIHSLLVPTLNAWNCSMCWHDPDADEIGVQLNGGGPVTAAYTFGLNPSPWSNTTRVQVGLRPYTLDDLFDGRMGHIALWNRVLTNDERLAFYNNGLGWRYLGRRRLPIQVNAPWMIAGGSPMPVIAYQAKASGSLIGSGTNVSDPGTYPIQIAGGVPAWDDARGWKFISANQNIFNTGYIPAAGGTLVLRFANDGGASTSSLTGNNTTGAFYRYRPNSAGVSQYVYGNTAVVGAPRASGVVAINEDGGYYNGLLDVPIVGATFGANLTPLYIGINVGGFNARTCDVLAWAFYAATLTAPQIAAVSAALAAL